MMLSAGGEGLSLTIFWLVVGGLAGWLASIVAGTHARMGCLLNIAVGIVGAVIGGWIFHNLGIQGPAGHPFLGSVLVSFVGATVLLLFLRLITGMRRR
jgi:uncharacterized membrane protein YeaQ/YmgE (transglycosylase-associated protein family)